MIGWLCSGGHDGAQVGASGSGGGSCCDDGGALAVGGGYEYVAWVDE